MKRLIPLVLILGFVACSKNSDTTSSPTSPSSTQQQTQTRVISLEGNMAFGNIQVGTSFEAVLRIWNRGTATMSVTGMTGPSGYSATWTNGQIAPGSSQASTIRFTPTEAKTYNGTLTVNADHTSGTNSMSISGTGIAPPPPAPTPTPSPAPTPAPAPAPAPTPSSCTAGPYKWDANVARCRASNGQFALSACCGR